MRYDASLCHPGTVGAEPPVSTGEAERMLNASANVQRWWSLN